MAQSIDTNTSTQKAKTCSQSKDDECGQCGSIVGGRDRGIMCEICERWFHTKCQKVSEDTYKVLKKESNLHWYCIGCDKSVAKILETLTKVQVRVEAVEIQLETVNGNVERMGLRIQELEEKLDHTEIVEVVKESINDEIENVTTKMTVRCALYIGEIQF